MVKWKHVFFIIFSALPSLTNTMETSVVLLHVLLALCLVSSVLQKAHQNNPFLLRYCLVRFYVISGTCICH